MKKAQSTLLILWMILLSVAAAASQSSSQTYQKTRRLLSHMKDYDQRLYTVSDPQFAALLGGIPSHEKRQRSRKTPGEDRLLLRSPMATLFRIGDERIGDLIHALDDPDRNISLHAQIMIRYLGNERGMKSLLKWYETQDFFPVAGAIPLPLNEMDFMNLKANYVEHPRDEWFHAEDYIYALALDDSPKAQELLKLMSEKAVDWQPVKSVLTGQPNKLLTGEKDLARLVLSNAFFISSDQKRSASAKFLAFNGAKDRALIEVLIEPGTWYYVVIRKDHGGWRFFSITSFAQCIVRAS